MHALRKKKNKTSPQPKAQAVSKCLQPLHSIWFSPMMSNPYHFLRFDLHNTSYLHARLKSIYWKLLYAFIIPRHGYFSALLANLPFPKCCIVEVIKKNSGAYILVCIKFLSPINPVLTDLQTPWVSKCIRAYKFLRFLTSWSLVYFPPLLILNHSLSIPIPPSDTPLSNCHSVYFSFGLHSRGSASMFCFHQCKISWVNSILKAGIYCNWLLL